MWTEQLKVVWKNLRRPNAGADDFISDRNFSSHLLYFEPVFFRLRCILRWERRALVFNPFVSFFVMIEPIWSERVLVYGKRVIMMFNFNANLPCLVQCSSHCCFLSPPALIQSWKENDELFYVRLRIVVVCTQKFLSFVCMWSRE